MRKEPVLRSGAGLVRRAGMIKVFATICLLYRASSLDARAIFLSVAACNISVQNRCRGAPVCYFGTLRLQR